jgi:hypothetical protein
MMTSSSAETEENHNSIPTGIPQESQIPAVGIRLAALTTPPEPKPDLNPAS